MRILFLARRSYPSVGGVEKHVLEIAKRLAGMGHKVVVVTEAISQNPKPQFLNPKQIPNPKFKIPNIEIYRIPVGRNEKLKKFRIWGWLWKNRRLIEKADIVHAHDVGFWYWPFRFLYPKKPFYITFHGWEGKFPVPFKNKLVRKISEKLAWGNICVGDYLEKWYGTKANYVTYGGVEISTNKQMSQINKSISNNQINKYQIAFVGRLEKDTGLPIYLEAVKRCKDANPPAGRAGMQRCKVIFLGEGSLRREAEKYGEVLGFVENIRPYLLQSRFVFTSGYLSILEAMACKRMVFAVYDNPLKEDYLRLSPLAKWIVIESNPESLYHRLVHDTRSIKEEERLISEAYDWVKGQTWEKVAELYVKLWKIL
jgi:glycosyltransferase involved in cell wall biosynthesis